MLLTPTSYSLQWQSRSTWSLFSQLKLYFIRDHRFHVHCQCLKGLRCSMDCQIHHRQHLQRQHRQGRQFGQQHQLINLRDLHYRRDHRCSLHLQSLQPRHLQLQNWKLKDQLHRFRRYLEVQKDLSCCPFSIQSCLSGLEDQRSLIRVLQSCCQCCFQSCCLGQIYYLSYFLRMNYLLALLIVGLKLLRSVLPGLQLRSISHRQCHR